MNEEQHNAAVAVERCQNEVRALARRLTEAEARLKAAESRLRTVIRRDPESWETLTSLPGGKQ
jgi:predicted  nucleic acid-binding Zn-ribbon protein